MLLIFTSIISHNNALRVHKIIKCMNTKERDLYISGCFSLYDHEVKTG